MKLKTLISKTPTALFIIILVITPLVLPAAEILNESEWSRLISGDRATWLTRQLDLTPVATDISMSVLTKIFKKAGVTDMNKEQLKNWQAGLQRWGWVQEENEPEYGAYHVTRLVATKEEQQKFFLQKFNLYGKTQAFVYDLEGNQLLSENIEITQTLDRSVFHTVSSPALFVLNQEHFQKQFFEEMLNLDYPGLEAAKKAYEQRKILLAANEVAEYFRRKLHPVWQTKIPEKQVVQDEAAEKVLRHEFAYDDTTLYLGERIDYRHNPTVDNEWIWGLNRMGHWVTLLRGYQRTANENYAREYNTDVIDWTVQNPAPPFRLTRVPSWRNLEAGIRMSQTWPRTFFGFLSSPTFQTQAIQLMLASLWSHGQHILRFPSGMRFVNNWVIIGSNGLAILGMSFPEFRDAAVWASTGLQRLSEQLNKQVYPDGMQHELASGYHLACMHSFHQAYEVAQLTGTPVPDNFKQALEGMFNYVMMISTPLRQLPPTNDSNRNDIRSWMKTGAELFNRADMLYFATDGEKGTPPEKTSAHFVWGGQSAMRSSWDEQALYLFFDAGPAGVSHQHEDKLHIDVSAFGRDFLTDGAKGSYIPDKWRAYFVSSRAHNTILIDGQGQRRISDQTTHRADSVEQRSWYSNQVLDYACGQYKDGYGQQHIPVIHTRHIIFKKNDYWLIIDELQGAGSHEFEVLYHFKPGEVAFDRRHQSVRTKFTDSRNLRLTANATVPFDSEILSGQENPEQGWIYENGHRLATPVVIFKGRDKLPVQIVTLIEPVKGEQDRQVNVAFLETVEGQSKIFVKGSWGEDQWLLNLERENHLIEEGRSTEAFIRLTRVRNGEVIENFAEKF